MGYFFKDKKVKVNKFSKRKSLWVIKISLLALSISLLLSLFSEMILNKANIFVAVILLVVFMMLNVFSDMLGLGVTSCQIENLKKKNLPRHIYYTSLKLVRNADKVSSILCDVVGDVCGILCGVSGSMISISLLTPISSLNIFISALVSAITSSLTVFLKSISKNYAVGHATEIVIKTSKFMNILSKSKKNKA